MTSTVSNKRTPLAQSARRLFQTKTVILGIVVVVVGYLALVPILFLLWGTLVEDGQLSWGAFGRAYSAAHLGVLIRNSLIYAVGGMAVSMVGGTAMAYLVVRTNIPFKRITMATALVPLIVPGILYTIAWIFLGSARVGIINTWLEPIFGPEAINVFSMTGMIFVQGMDNAPLAFLIMYAGFRSMDPSLEESAAMSGASWPSVFLRITLPVNRPAVFAAILILFIRNLESFETPALLGLPVGIFVFTSRIWRSLQFPPDYGQAGALSLGLLALVSIGVYFYQRMQTRSFATVSGKGFRPRVIALGRWRAAVTAALVVYLMISVVLPILALIYISSQPYFRVPTLETIADANLENYRFILSSGQSIRAFSNSVVLALGTATLTMLLMAVGAWIVIRSKLRGAWILDNLAFLPLVVPGLVLGVALIFVYTRIPVGIYGTMWILLIAFCTKNMPYGMRAALTSMVQISRELEESAETSGASWWQRFRRVVLPLLMPGLMAGWIYIMITSIRELSTALLLYPAGGEVLAVLIWSLYDHGRFVELSALGIMMIALTSILIVIAQRMGARFGLKAPSS